MAEDRVVRKLWRASTRGRLKFAWFHTLPRSSDDMQKPLAFFKLYCVLVDIKYFSVSVQFSLSELMVCLHHVCMKKLLQFYFILETKLET